MEKIQAMTLQQALLERRPSLYPEGRFEGRGIVICAGGQRYFTCAWVLISILRHVYHIELPIQLWHLGQREMSEEMRLLLEEQRVEVIDAEGVIARFPARVAGGWPLKPYAITHSRFREVLYLDADTVPLANPLQPFGWPQYTEQGMLFWPDLVDLRADNPIWDKIGLAPRACPSIDSGLLVVDKQRCWDMLQTAVLLNEHVEDVYSAIHGDKDTFLLASLLTGRSPAIMPHRPFPFGFSDFVQRDLAGDPFLHHRSTSKWNLAEPNQPLATEALMPRCEEALAQLRRRWDGVVFHPPARSEAARAEEARLIALRHFYYEAWGAQSRRLDLLPGGRVGEGRGEFERHWAVLEREGGFVLQFFSMARLTIELERRDDGSWQGRSVTPIPFGAWMIEEVARRSWPHEGSERVARPAAALVAALIDPTLFAAGFDAERLVELRAALSLLNDRFDDVPEQLDARCAAIALPRAWQRALVEISTALAMRRDQRMLLTKPVAHPRTLDLRGYDRVP